MWDEWHGWWAWSDGRWYQWFYGEWWYWDYDQDMWARWREPAPSTTTRASLIERRRSRSPPGPEPDAQGELPEAVLVRALKRMRLA